MNRRPVRVAASAPRLADLDHLRTSLTALVIAHHSAIAFGASGGWYYVVPAPKGSLAPLVLTLFAGVNQAFFMALFFAIAGHFTPSAFASKGPRAFLRDRFARLGIPLVVYFFVLNPIVVYLARRFEGRTSLSFVSFVAANVPGVFGTGPLWFVLALLVFALAYTTREKLRTRPADPHPFPASDAVIVRFAIAIGLIAFCVRIVFPVGWAVLGLQLGYFPLYIALFFFGILARRDAWLAAIDRRRAIRWFRAALVAIAVMPAAIVLGGGASDGGEAFRGGISWQALVYALWEPVVCIGVSLRLLVLFRERFSGTTRFSARLDRSAYAAYILHPLVVVPLTAAIAPRPGGPIVHFVALATAAIGVSFAAADLVRRAPGARRIL